MIRSLLRCLDLSESIIDEYVDGQLKEAPVPGLGVTSRSLQQTLGTDWGRDAVATDLWVQIAMREAQALILSGQRVVIDDVRFPDEVAAIKQLGGITMRVHRPGAAADPEGHRAETALVGHDMDIDITNDGTIPQLHRAVWMAVADWRQHEPR